MPSRACGRACRRTWSSCCSASCSARRRAGRRPRRRRGAAETDLQFPRHTTATVVIILAAPIPADLLVPLNDVRGRPDPRPTDDDGRKEADAQFAPGPQVLVLHHCRGAVVVVVLLLLTVGGNQGVVCGIARTAHVAAKIVAAVQHPRWRMEVLFRGPRRRGWFRSRIIILAGRAPEGVEEI